jgi:signal transduction histidine kinase
VAFVKEATEFAKKSGFKKACDTFNDSDKFKRGEFYIFAYDYKGVALCHGAKKALIGKDLSGLKDKKGTAIIQEFLKNVQSGSGFVKYYWEHPSDKKLKRKLGYGEKVDDKYWIGSGIYYEERK